MTFRKHALLHHFNNDLTERGSVVRLTFAERLEQTLGRKLPASAHKFSAWWGNRKTSMKVGHTQAKAWMNAGFRAHASN